jgi:hypothetical protein
MLKNLCVLGLLTWVSFTYAKHPHHVAHETIGSAEAYKVEKPVEEQEAQRSVAGSKIKRTAPTKGGDGAKSADSETDSEVRYWQYSE